MCNLYSNTTTVEAMRQLFDVSQDHMHLGNQAPQSAIFPKYMAPVMRLSGGERELVKMHWGFLMPQTSAKTGKPILPKAVNNARDDKVRTSPFWKASFTERRCLVPATSFCEAKGRNPATYYWFGLKGDGPRPVFAFAGMWRHWKGNIKGELTEFDTYTILTTGPNDLVRPIHPSRMPVILEEDDYETWLSGSEDDAFALAKRFPAEKMEIKRSGEGMKEDALEG